MVQLTKKELVKTAKQYNDKSCIKKVSTLSKNQLVSQLHSKGVKVKSDKSDSSWLKDKKYDKLKKGAIAHLKSQSKGKTKDKNAAWLEDKKFDNFKKSYITHLKNQK
jgi:hypothetical protein